MEITNIDDDEDDEFQNYINIQSLESMSDTAQLLYFIMKPDALFVNKDKSVFIQAKLTMGKGSNAQRSDVSALTLYEVSEEKEEDQIFEDEKGSSARIVKPEPQS